MSADFALKGDAVMASRSSGVSFTLWPACVKTHSFEAQVAAASQAGYDSLAIGYLTYKALRAQGYSDETIKALVADAGISLSHFDGFTDWAPQRYATSLPEPAKAVFDVSASECLEICEALELSAICATGSFDPGRYSVARLADAMTAFAGRADALGIAVDLEFIPMFSIPSLGMAWDIVRASEAGNLSLLFDTWHYLRGARDDALLAALPAGSIRTLQIADAALNMQGSDLFDDCLRYRQPAGEGQLPLPALLDIVLAKDGIQSIGPEVFSDQLDAMPAERAADLCAQRTRQILARAVI